MQIQFVIGKEIYFNRKLNDITKEELIGHSLRDSSKLKKFKIPFNVRNC
jgi:hypothetical protein